MAPDTLPVNYHYHVLTQIENLAGEKATPLPADVSQAQGSKALQLVSLQEIINIEDSDEAFQDDCVQLSEVMHDNTNDGSNN